jgi:KTSC domain
MNAKALLLFSLLALSRPAIAESTGQSSQPWRPVISHIPHAQVISTGIASVGYSRRRHILEIEFVNGAVYRYLQVSPGTFRDLMTADSKARFYDSNIRGRYLSLRVRARSKP